MTKVYRTQRVQAKSSHKSTCSQVYFSIHENKNSIISSHMDFVVLLLYGNSN